MVISDPANANRTVRASSEELAFRSIPVADDQLEAMGFTQPPGGSLRSSSGLLGTPTVAYVFNTPIPDTPGAI